MADVPSIPDELLKVKAEVDRLAAIINVPPKLLPMYGGWPEGFHVEYGGNYYFINVERGKELGRVIVSTLDEILYEVFRQITWSMAFEYARQFIGSTPDIRLVHFPRQLELLGLLSPQWAEQRRKEQEKLLRKN